MKNRVSYKILAFALLLAVMILTLIPVFSLTASAAGSDADTIDLSVDNINTIYPNWSYNSVTGVYSVTGDVTITGARSGVDGTANQAVITVNGGTINITLQDAAINVSNTSAACAFLITGGATVNLTLGGNSTLTSGYDRAGLEVSTGNTVVIDSSSGGIADSLTATGGSGGYGGAGIGGIGNGGSGGTVNANGGGAGAGIGGGGGAGGGGTITINGGTVTANGGLGVNNSGGGAGVGGGGGLGNGGSGGTITITGGTVNATGGSGKDVGGGGGAGVGGGGGVNDGGVGGTITITGGTVNAIGGAGGTNCGVGASVGGGGSRSMNAGKEAIYFTSHPASKTVTEGSISANLTVGAAVYTDTPALTYQWYSNTSNSNSGGTSAGVPSASADFPIPTNLTAGTCYYYCVVAAAGFETATSKVAAVTVNPFISVTSVTLNKIVLTLTAGYSESLAATVEPAAATNKAVSWSSSNPNVATVDISGKVTAVAAGMATITATSTDGSNKAASCAVTVAATAPGITTATLPNGTVGTAYSQTLSASGTTPITWALDSGSLPGGLALSGGGLISGTPTAAGTYNFSVKATNAAGSATKALSIKIDSSGSGGGGGGGGGTPTTPPTTTTPPPTGSTETEIGGNTVTTPPGQPPVTDENGTTTLPGGGTLETDNGTVIALPPGTTIDKSGKITVGEGGATAKRGGATLRIAAGTVLIMDEEVPLGYYPAIINPFIDVQASDWFYGDVMFVYSHGLFAGTSVTPMLFSPNAQMTRAMFITVLARLEGIDLTGGATWYSKAVEWAANNGIADGTELDAPITREDMALMLYNYLKYKGYTLPSAAAEAFADEEQISPGALDAVRAIQAIGVINGRPGNVYDPHATATRAEVARIFANCVNYLAK